METKKYKTAAAIRSIMEDRLASEKRDLAAHQDRAGYIQARINVIIDLLAAADANGKEEGENA